MKPTRFLAGALLLLIFVACTRIVDDDSTALLALHEQILDAHRNRDVHAWDAVEAETLVVGSRGRVTRSTRSERLAARERYFAATRFSVYRDVESPEVRVSADRTLGWVLATVEVVAHPTDGAESDSTHTIWAWIEMYERRDGRWRLVGNVSTEQGSSG